MFSQMIESAFASGGEVTVYLKGQPDPFRGSVRDINGEYFTLFHSGCCSGMLWSLRLDDVQACGLVVPPPDGHDVFHHEAELPREH